MANPFAIYGLNDAQRFPCSHVVDRPSTLFYADFKVAERFGIAAVWDTFRRCGDLKERDTKEVTELYVVLNHLEWEAHDKNEELKANGKYSPCLIKAEPFYSRKQGEIRRLVDGWSDENKVHFFKVTD